MNLDIILTFDKMIFNLTFDEVIGPKISIIFIVFDETIFDKVSDSQLRNMPLKQKICLAKQKQFELIQIN